MPLITTKKSSIETLVQTNKQTSIRELEYDFSDNFDISGSQKLVTSAELTWYFRGFSFLLASTY